MKATDILRLVIAIPVALIGAPFVIAGLHRLYLSITLFDSGFVVQSLTSLAVGIAVLGIAYLITPTKQTETTA